MTACHHGIFLLTATSLLVAVGCKKTNPGAPASITGKVTYNGAPVAGGTITFHTSDGAMSAAIGSDGKFVCTDMPVGETPVTIETESANPDKAPEVYGPNSGNPMAGNPMASKYGKGSAAKSAGASNSSTSPAPANSSPSSGSYVKIPARYADKDQSKLTVTLVKGETKKDFPLTD